MIRRRLLVVGLPLARLLRSLLLRLFLVVLGFNIFVLAGLAPAVFLHPAAEHP